MGGGVYGYGCGCEWWWLVAVIVGSGNGFTSVGNGNEFVGGRVEIENKKIIKIIIF